MKQYKIAFTCVKRYSWGILKILRVYLRKKMIGIGSIISSREEGAPSCCAKWMTYTGRWEQEGGCYTGQKAGWLWQGYCLLGNPGNLSRREDLTDHKRFLIDRSNIPFLGQPRLWLTQHSGCVAEHMGLHLGPVVLFFFLTHTRKEKL